MKHGEVLKSKVEFTWNSNDGGKLQPHFSFPKELSADQAIEVVQMMRDALDKNLEQSRLCKLHNAGPPRI